MQIQQYLKLFLQFSGRFFLPEHNKKLPNKISTAYASLLLSTVMGPVNKALTQVLCAESRYKTLYFCGSIYKIE